MERRECTRYRLACQVRFSWKNEEQERFHGRGITRDISARGAFILSAACPPAAATVHLKILIAPDPPDAPSARLRGDAQVLRVEQATGGQEQGGFAVVTKGFALWST